jgi:hypothetical protein
MRTLQLDGSGNKNQDRSIQPSAIVGELPPFALAAPTPGPAPGTTAAPPAPAPPAPGVTPAPPAAAVPTTPGGPRITPPPTATLADGPPPAREPDSAALAGFFTAGALMVAWMASHRRRVLRRRDS